MKKSVVFGLVLILAIGNAYAINKCTGADGKIVFQDAPCSGKGESITVKPASGPAATPLQAEVSGSKPIAQSGTQKLLDSMKDERVRREKWSEMVYANKMLKEARNQCDAEQKRLAEAKNLSKNNLAGATRDVSISQEMTAAAMLCDSRTRQKEKELADAEQVCKEIKCIPSN